MFLIGAIQLTYIVCIIVIFLFACAFIGIASLFFNAKKALYLNRMEDGKVQEDVDKKFLKLQKKKKGKEEVLDTYQREMKSSKRFSRVWGVILGILYVAVISLAVYGAISRVGGNQLFIGNQAAVIIETSSMQDAYSGNKYLKENDLLGDENRINQYSLITLDKVKSPDDLEVMKVYAFKMESAEKGRMITIVHRLINIETDSKTGEKLFTFRGDSNVTSMVGEYQIKFDMIVGSWTGYKNQGLGYLVVYLQSPIGIITLVIAFLLLILYSILYSKMTDKYNARFYQLLNQKYCFVKALEGEKSVFVYPSHLDKEQEYKPLFHPKKENNRIPYIDEPLPVSLTNFVSSSLADCKLVEKDTNYLYPFDYQTGFFGNGQHVYKGSMRDGVYHFEYKEKPKMSKRMSYHEKYPLKIFLLGKARNYFIIHEVKNGSDYVEYTGNEKEVHTFFIRFFDSKSYNNSITRYAFICVDEKMRRS